uniref:Uncharacterized protein n=1 Tax=Acrobeloides nanus TaxID=290746 RepID=A0A914CRQ0_9BILA
MPYMNGKSNGQIALKHPTTELTTPLENEEEDTTEFEEEELRQEEQNNLRHSPTEDEDEPISTERQNLKIPVTPATAQISPFPDEVDVSPSPETDSGTEGHFDENFTSPLPKTRLPEQGETESLHINDPNEFPPLGASIPIVTG